MRKICTVPMSPCRPGSRCPRSAIRCFPAEPPTARRSGSAGEQDGSDIEKWTALQYRFGPENGPPELVFPKNPGEGKPTLFFSHEESKGDYRVTVRFTTGGYTYRVFSGSESGAGVRVEDAKGKRLATVECGERPQIFPDYLRLALPCDPLNPHGEAACRKSPFRAK